MTHSKSRHRLRSALSALALISSVATGSIALAAPGAHGPNGEHLDAPATTGAIAAAASRPRFEARSETFELVGHMQGGELSMLINRYDTNEPVLDAKVEVESGDRRASAKFHADLGDYAVEDPAFLEALSKEGEHALLITIVAGSDSDLLDATLKVAPVDHGHAHEQWAVTSRTGLLAGGLIVAVVVGGGLLARHRGTGTRRPASNEVDAV